MVVAINVGESGGIGSMLRTRISISTESARTHKKERKKREKKTKKREKARRDIH